MSKLLWTIALAIGAAVAGGIAALARIWKIGQGGEIEDFSVPPPSATVATTTMDSRLDFSTPQAAFHSTRVICDEIGLSYQKKNTLCACIYQESRFLTNPKPNQNKDPKTGKVWSTDYGIAQVNDYFHIGPGKEFPSVQWVLDNPEEIIRWMAGILEKTGRLQPWASYTSGAYLRWLPKSSPMWALQTGG